jgi:hypothetical protein
MSKKEFKRESKEKKPVLAICYDFVAEKMGMSLCEEFADETNIKTSVYSITRSQFSTMNIRN